MTAYLKRYNYFFKEGIKMKQLRNFNGGDSVPKEVKDNPKLLEAMQKYGGMGEDALIEQLVSQIRTQKQNGTYNPAQMNSYMQMLSMYLSDAQKEKLQMVLKILEMEA